MNCTDTTYLTDEEIISSAKLIPTEKFLASNQSKSRIDTVKGILAAGYNVAIVYWHDGAMAYIPLKPNQNVASATMLIKAHRAFHAASSKNPNLRGRVWTKV